MKKLRTTKFICIAMTAVLLFVLAGGVYALDNDNDRQYKTALRINDAYSPMALNKFAPEALTMLGEGVQLIGTVGEVEKIDDISTYELRGYSGGKIEVDTSEAKPLVNEDVYIVGTVRVRQDGSPYVNEEKRFDTNRSEITDWMDQSEIYALSCCFRSYICRPPEGMPVIDRADWIAGVRTQPGDIRDWMKGVLPPKDTDKDGISDRNDPDKDGDGQVDQFVGCGMGLGNKDLDGDGVRDIGDRDMDGDGIPNGSDPEPYKRGIPWYYWVAGAVVAVLVLLVIVGLIMLIARGGRLQTGSKVIQSDIRRAEPEPTGVAPSGPIPSSPAIEEGTVVRSRGTEVQVSDQATIVRGPAYLEVSAGGEKTGTTINLLRPETLMGRGRRSDTKFPNIPNKNFVKLDMSDRPAEDRKYCSREYCLFRLEDDDEYSIENVTEGDNWVLVNGDQVHKGDAKKLSDGDKVKLDPDWEFVYHKTRK